MSASNLVGYVRQLDDLGRVVIPWDVRRILGWGLGTGVEIEIQDLNAKIITMRQVAPCCSLCGENYKDLVSIENGYVCPKCVELTGVHAERFLSAGSVISLPVDRDD